MQNKRDFQSKQSSKKKRKKKKKFSWKAFVCFIIFEFVFTAITGPLLVFYGPFQNVKKTVVGTAMQTFSHQFIAKAFLSDKQINAILKGDDGSSSDEQASGSEQQDVSKIKVSNNHDSNIERYDIQGKKFDAYILEIKDPTRVKVGMTNKVGKQGERTSQIAEEHDAVAAINGGGFTDKSADGKLWAGTGAFPTGVVMIDGQVKYSDLNSNDEKVDIMGLNRKGILIVGKYSINELKNIGIQQAIGFGPALVVNGKPAKGLDPGPNPRTCIGQKADGTIILLVIDGRQGLKVGATLKEAQEIMMQYGAVNATNLDGGSSSTMYYNSEIINNPCDPLGERSVATAVYVEP